MNTCPSPRVSNRQPDPEVRVTDLLFLSSKQITRRPFPDYEKNCLFSDTETDHIVKDQENQKNSVDGHNLTNPIVEFKENRYRRVKAWFIPNRTGNSRLERLTGVAIKDMVCSHFFEIEPRLQMDYIRVPEKNNSTSCLSFAMPSVLHPPTRISICAAGWAL
jgi:hypothetical protein